MSLNPERVAIVTGGASGIGFATATRLFRSGLKVAVLDVDPKVNDLLPEEPGRAVRLRPYEVDLRDDQATRRAVEELVAEFGRVDILINNAGINPKNEGGKFLVEDIPRSVWDEVYQVNLIAPWGLCRAVLPGMKQARWGRIVNISSAGALGRPLASSAYYISAKAALFGLTRCVAEEGARFGITANAIAPGPIRTGLTALSSPETIAKLTQSVPVGRYGAPEEVAAAVEFLCSEEASFVTGTILPVDGGSVMH